MRTEQEIYDLILKVAREDERVRAVYIDGSRTNPNAPKDMFQDYDVGYVVRETESFIKDRDWTERMFGEILYMQRPDEFAEFFPDEGVDITKCYGWLMQFADGNRIDLHVETIAAAQEGFFDDTLRKILLDKDGILPTIPESSDRGYFVKKPAEKEYLCICNEFWWCLNNIAKGLWRGELTYVQDMTNHVVRRQLEKILSWKIGLLTNWSVAVGKSGKYMHRWLPKKEWEEYLSTWFSCDVKEAWEACLRMCALFDRTAREVGAGLGYEYNQTEAENSFSYFKHVRTLSADATEVYSERQKMDLPEKDEKVSNIREKLHTGELYLPNDEEIIKEQVVYQDRLCDYNRTKPSESEKRAKMLKEMLAECGEGVYIEAPFYSNFGGHHCHFGKMVYANYHLTCVDDTHIYIGDYTMIGPNVTIATAGHPILPELREKVYQYNMPVHIGRNCWIGAGAIIMPGVNIGDNTVIGAGSVVTKDIPENVVAVGNPCRVMREIGEHDREYYYRDKKIITD